MKTYKSAEMKKFTKRPGLIGTFVHGKDLTLAHWLFEKGMPLASHSHTHAQISYVVSGKVRFEAGDGSAKVVEAGDFVVFAPNETHGGLALEDSLVLDAFSPAREDFKEEMGWKD